VATRWWLDVRKGVELSPIENNARRSRRNGTQSGRETDRNERRERRRRRRRRRRGGGRTSRRGRRRRRRVVALGVHKGVHSMGSSEQCPAAFDYNVGRNNRIAHGPLKRLHRLTDDRPR